MKPVASRVSATGDALQAYLDQLLFEATEEAAPAAVAVPCPVPMAAPGGPAEAESPSGAAARGPALAEGCAPEWGRAPFQALACRVGALRIAVPLVKLNEVVPYRGGCSVIAHAPAWILGVLPHRGRQVRVVDLARLILPRRDADAESGGSSEISDLLLVGDGLWGLGCQEIGEVMRVQPDQVRWRSASGRRPWLAGTVIEQLCALLDVDVLPALLRRGVSLAHGA